jgi:hypothetical protein
MVPAVYEWREFAVAGRRSIFRTLEMLAHPRCDSRPVIPSRKIPLFRPFRFPDFDWPSTAAAINKMPAPEKAGLNAPN